MELQNDALVEKARQIAFEKHAGQMYNNTEPYTIHLQKVVDALIELGEEDPEILAAGWLHDVVEDTETDLKYLIGEGMTVYVVALVDAVTDRPGKNREERKAATYPRIRRMEQAVTLKLADRIANVRRCLKEEKKSLYQMYQHEWRTFYRMMGGTDHQNNDKAWAILIELLGNPLYPRK